MNDDDLYDYARLEDDGHPLFFFPEDLEGGDDFTTYGELEGIRSFAGCLMEALDETLESPLTDEHIDRFIKEVAPKMNLTAAWRKELDSLPKEMPGERERAMAYEKTRFQVPHSSENQLRISYCDTGNCEGREVEIKQSLWFLTKPGPRILFLTGVAGIGKTAVARTVANAVVNKADAFASVSPSNICFFDCEGLSTDSEMLGLIVATLFDNPLRNVPESLEKHVAIITERLASLAVHHRDMILWIFDGLDEYWEGSHDNVGAGNFLELLLDACAKATNLFKVVITLRTVRKEAPYWKYLSKRISYDALHKIPVAPLRKIHVEGNLHRSGIGAQPERSFLRHPLASRMLMALRKRYPHSVPEQLALFEDDIELPLNEACTYAWSELLEEEKRILFICAELPGGIWLFNHSQQPEGDDVDWGRLFDNAQWKERLDRLCSAEWLTKRLDRLHSHDHAQTYRVRPALSEFVRHHKENDRGQVLRRIGYFWSVKLKVWGRRIVGRVTDGIQPKMIGGFRQSVILRAEESARYLMDVTRVNWLHAFRCIPALAESRNKIVLSHIYLRSAICYFRMSGSLRLFSNLVDMACAAQDKAYRHEARSSVWRKIAVAVYRGSCFGMKGRTHRRLGEWQQAEDSLSRAESMLLEQVPSSAAVRRELAWAFTEHGRLWHLTGRWGEAEEKFKTAVKLRRQLVADSIKRARAEESIAMPHVVGRVHRCDSEWRFLASSLNSYGNLLTDRFQWKEAEMLQRKALKIRKKLAHHNSCYFERYVANSYNDLANALYYQNEMGKAGKLYDEALKIREFLVPNAESALGQYVARTCNNLGNCRRKAGQWEEARKYFERAVRIYRIGASEVAAKFDYLLARTLSNLGRVYHQQGLVREAVKALEEADRIHASVSAAMVTPFKWVETCNYLALAYGEIGALNYASHSVRKAELLLEKHGGNVCEVNTLWFRAYTLDTKGQTLSLSESRADWSKAESAFRESERQLFLLNKMISAPQMFEAQFAQIWHDLGTVLYKLERLEESRIYLTDALASRRRLAVINPRYMKHLVGHAALALADTLCALRLSSEAHGLYRESHRIFVDESKSNPTGFRCELQRSQMQLELLEKVHLASEPSQCVEYRRLQ